MSFTAEKLEGNMAKITITRPAEEFEKAIVSAYNKNKNRFQVPGFRKGHVPMNMIEKMYGVAVFYEDAANEVISKSYGEEIENCDLDIASRPTIDVVQIEKGKDFIYTAEVAVKPEVELGAYKGIEIKKVDTVVTDEEVDKEIDRVRKQNARKVDVTDRAAKMDDMTVIDFDGSVDGVAFDGGKGTDYPLTLGSHSFIEGFEEQIVGHNINDEFDVNVTFPEDYHAEELKGKPAVFKCKLKAISENILPELNDEFVGDVSEFETVDEYKADTRKRLEERKQKAAKSQKEGQAIEKLVASSKMDIPAPMIEGQQERMFEEFTQQLRMQGLTMDQYFQFTGMNREMFNEQMKPEAERRIKNSLVLEAVAKAEDIPVSDEEVDEELKAMAESYKMDLEKIKSILGDKQLDSVREDLKLRKAVDLIVENAVETDAE